MTDPVSKLFLSCDLTGSTDFKQRRSAEIPWQQVFLAFYRGFPQVVSITQREEGTEDLTFDLWKPVGDELIYSCDVKSESDVHRAVRTWVKAIRAYEAQSLDDTTMGTKGGAFIATFPGPDSESTVPRHPDLEVSDADVVELNTRALRERHHDTYVYDYFGPSIDTGFRILNKCDARYFTISVEVALAMIGRSKVPGTNQPHFHVDDLVLLDFVELKGVWAGKRYPIIALDLEYDDPVNEAYARFEKRTGRDDIETLCLSCYQAPDWPSKLYLPESQDDRFQILPPPDPFEGIATASSQGAERKAMDEPHDAAALVDDPPLGDAKYRTGFTQMKVSADTPRRKAHDKLLRLSEDEAVLKPNERITRWRPQPPIPAAEPDKLIYSAYWDVGLISP